MNSYIHSGFSFGAREESRLSQIAFASIWLVVFSVPWEKSVMVAGFGSISRLIGAAALVSGFTAILARRRVRRPLPAHILLAVFGLWTGLTYWWTLSPSETQEKAITCLRLIGMTWLIWEIAQQERHRGSLMRAYIAGTVVAACQTIRNYLANESAVGGSFHGRYAPSGFNPNDLGLTVALSIPLSYYLMIRSSGIRAWLFRAHIFLCVITIGLTASRSALIALLVASAIVPLTLRWLTTPQRALTAILVATSAVGAVWLLPDSSWEILSTTENEITKGTLDTRTEIWKAGLDVFWHHPFLGVGAGAYPIAVEPILGTPQQSGEEWTTGDEKDQAAQYVAHNTFLSVLVETGIVGCILFCAALLSIIPAVTRMGSLERRLWITVGAVWLTAASVSTWEDRKPTWVLFSLVVIPCATQQPARRRRSLHSAFLVTRPDAITSLCTSTVSRSQSRPDGKQETRCP